MTNHQADVELARRIAAGDEDAMREIVERHHGPIYLFLSRLCRHREDAEDLVQQTFIKVSQQAASFRGKSGIKAWLFRIAFHEFTHWRRRVQPVRLQAGDEQQEESFEGRIVEAQALREALSQMDSKHSSALILLEVDGFTVPEIAHIQSVPVGTVKSRLHHARRKLRSLIDSQEEAIRYEAQTCES